jgi:REP element-mobilizing transposase RayT
MSRYRRAKVDGGVFFFTVALADRSSDLLLRHIDRLRRIYASVQQRYPFETVAICVLPDHLHAVWSLPPGDANFSVRWNVIKGGFTRGLAGEAQRSYSKIARRERGSGSAAIGSTLFVTMLIWRGMSTTFTSILSNTDMSREFAIGHTAAFIAMSSAVCYRWTGAVMSEQQMTPSGND